MNRILNTGALVWTVIFFTGVVIPVVECSAQENLKNLSIPAKEYNGGTFASFEKGMEGWHGSDNIRIFKVKNALVAEGVAVGLEHQRFGIHLRPNVDFSKDHVLKVRARAEGDKMPVLRIDLKDIENNVTNRIDSKARIYLCEEFKDYYFNYKGKMEQGWPFLVKIDAVNIAELEFFINPGGPPFTGRIFIEKIEVLSEEEMISMIPDYSITCGPGIHYKGETEIKNWMPNSALYHITPVSGAIKITSRGSGPGYESFSRGFRPADMTQKPVVRIKAMVKGPSAADLRMDVLDHESYESNGKSISHTLPNDGEFHDYYFNYLDKFYQNWPKTFSIDKRLICELKFFLNPGQEPFYGDLYISEIELLDNYIEKATESCRKSDPVILSSANSPDIWWTNDTEIQCTLKNHELYITFREAGVNGFVSRGFDEKNFYERPVLFLRAKASAAERIVSAQLHDLRGVFTEEVQPYVVSVSHYEYILYYFDFSDSWNKSALLPDRIRGQSITGLLLRLNSEADDESIIIDEIGIMDQMPLMK